MISESHHGFPPRASKSMAFAGILWSVCILMLLSLASCQGQSLPAAPGGTIRVGYPSEPDFEDLPSLLAHDRLHSRGYEVETTFFAQSEPAVEALATGDVDLSHGSLRTHRAAISEGADIVTVMEHAANSWIIMAQPSIQTCAAALLAGEIDAAPVEIADAVRMRAQAPGSLHVLANFAQHLPDLKVAGVHANRGFLEQRPEAARDYLGALLEVNAEIQRDPSSLIEAAREHIGMQPGSAREIAEAYLEIRAWPTDGGLTRAGAEYSLEFYISSDQLPEDLTAERVIDLTFLERALNRSANRRAP